MSRMIELSATRIDEDRARLHASHSPTGNASFWIRSRVLIGRRFLRNIASGDQFHRYARAAHIPDGSRLLADDEHRLYTTADPREQELELGKVQNLRMAAAAVDGIVLEPGETFSFWRAAGRPSRRRSYVTGRELRQGCMIASTGGGICQLTNAISRIASRAGMEIAERHSHTLHPPGFFIDDATDATVYWNYVDLRFRAPARVRLGARLTQNTLVVRLDALP